MQRVANWGFHGRCLCYQDAHYLLCLCLKALAMLQEVETVTTREAVCETDRDREIHESVVYDVQYCQRLSCTGVAQVAAWCPASQACVLVSGCNSKRSNFSAWPSIHIALAVAPCPKQRQNPHASTTGHSHLISTAPAHMFLCAGDLVTRPTGHVCVRPWHWESRRFYVFGQAGAPHWPSFSQKLWVYAPICS